MRQAVFWRCSSIKALTCCPLRGIPKAAWILLAYWAAISPGLAAIRSSTS